VLLGRAAKAGRVAVARFSPRPNLTLYLDGIYTRIQDAAMASNVHPDELTNRFRQNVRKRREALGMTQAALAGKIGAHGPYISDLEAGKKIPVLATLAKLADALSVTPADLIS
jgi:ribosome-binding protein aMBF1 (putative translation factor)